MMLAVLVVENPPSGLAILHFGAKSREAAPNRQAPTVGYESKADAGMLDRIFPIRVAICIRDRARRTQRR